VIEPSVASQDRRVRAAAIAALAKHAGADAPRWIERGLGDPEPCVRTEAVRFLGRLDPRHHRAVFELARHDPNPDIAARARKLLLRKRRST
jgi:HEAT repeat protein